MGSFTRARVDLPLILCVDDEPEILEALRDTLHRYFEVATATSGEAALALLSDDPGRFSVVISDMRMPAMSGAVFLAQARKHAPDATRILLTGYADIDAAVAAVNDAQLFRFLTKPCRGRELVETCQAALEQHRLRTAEKVLLEQTLKGSVRALSDVLGLASPAAFGRSASIRKLVAQLAQALEVEDPWEVEVSALLVHLGAVTLPAETAEKLYSGTALSRAEQRMVEQVPELTRRILEHIPRLEGVLEILASYQRDYARAGAGRSLPLGSRILRVALDYDALEAHGSDPDVVLAALRGRDRAYDPDLLRALEGLLGDNGGPRKIIGISLLGLRPGMMLADDVRSSTGNLLIARGHTATDQLITRLWNLRTGAVREPLMVLEQ